MNQFSFFLFSASFLLGLAASCGVSTGPKGPVDSDTPEGVDPETRQKVEVVEIQNKPGVHTYLGWKNLPIPVSFSKEFSPELKDQVKKSILTWEKALGVSLVKYNDDHGTDGDSFSDMYDSLDDDVMGFYLINSNWGSRTKRENTIIGTAIWSNLLNSAGEPVFITGADIHFNSEFYNLGDALSLKETDKRRVVDMESLALHEFGHFLGLGHVDESADPNSIMNPALLIGPGNTQRTISQGDVDRLRSIYLDSQRDTDGFSLASSAGVLALQEEGTENKKSTEPLYKKVFRSH